MLDVTRAPGMARESMKSVIGERTVYSRPDLKKEFSVWKYETTTECRWKNVTEPVGPFDIAPDATYNGTTVVRGRKCEDWASDYFDTHYFVESKSPYCAMVEMSYVMMKPDKRAKIEYTEWKDLDHVSPDEFLPPKDVLEKCTPKTAPDDASDALHLPRAYWRRK